jgi:hypothetical protein
MTLRNRRQTTSLKTLMDEMLEDDEITAAEEGFMRNRDTAMKKMEEEMKKGRKPKILSDGISVTLNEEQHEED